MSAEWPVSESADRTLGRIEGMLKGVREDVHELKGDVGGLRQGFLASREELQTLRSDVSRAAAKFDPETGCLRPEYRSRPNDYGQGPEHVHPSPSGPIAVVDQEKAARAGLWQSLAKFVAVLGGAVAAAAAYVFGSR